MAKSFNPFMTRNINKFMYEFESILDPTYDEYDWGCDAQKFDSVQPFSICFIYNGVMQVIYFTDEYVMNWVAGLVYDVIDDDVTVTNRFETP